MTSSLHRVPPDHAGRPVCHLLRRPAGEGARANPGARGGPEAGQREVGVGGRPKGDGLRSAVLGHRPRPGHRRPDRENKRLFYCSLAVPCPFLQHSPGSLSMLDKELDVPGLGERGRALGAHTVRRRHPRGGQRPPTWVTQQLNTEAPNLHASQPVALRAPDSRPLSRWLGRHFILLTGDFSWAAGCPADGRTPPGWGWARVRREPLPVLLAHGPRTRAIGQHWRGLKFLVPAPRLGWGCYHLPWLLQTLRHHDRSRGTLASPSLLPGALGRHSLCGLRSGRYLAQALWAGHILVRRSTLSRTGRKVAPVA